MEPRVTRSTTTLATTVAVRLATLALTANVSVINDNYYIKSFASDCFVSVVSVSIVVVVARVLRVDNELVPFCDVVAGYCRGNPSVVVCVYRCGPVQV